MSSAGILWKKGQKEIEKGTYETRKYQVTTVKGTIPSASDWNVDTINNKIDSAIEKLQDAIKGITSVSTLVNDMAVLKEKNGTSDGYLSNYKDDLSGEIKDCETKIDNLNSEIVSLNRQYQIAFQKEQEEIQKALGM